MTSRLFLSIGVLVDDKERQEYEVVSKNLSKPFTRIPQTLPDSGFGLLVFIKVTIPGGTRLLPQSNVLGKAGAHQALFETDVQKHRRSTGIIGIDMQCCL